MKYLMIYVVCCFLWSCEGNTGQETDKFQTPPPNSGTELEMQRVNDALEIDSTNYQPSERKQPDSSDR
jgi:hypothetical protein